MKKLSYSHFGKHTKGFLCMVTFFVFMFSFTFTVCGTILYGLDIITSFENNYFSSDRYERDLSNEAMGLLYTISDAAGADKEFSITYIEDGIIKEYESKAYTIGKYSWENVMEDETYLLSARKYSSSRFYNPVSLKIYLNSNLAENNYLYFSDEAFQKLFIQEGFVNTGYRYSADFPETAYFVFECSADMREFLENTEQAANVVEDMTYAVYDPENRVYFSTEDQYFAPMERYVYEAAMVNASLSAIETEDVSLVFLFLRSGNLSDELWYKLEDNYSYAEAAEDMLNVRDDSNFYYYYESPNYTVSNVDVVADITELEYAYVMENGRLDFVGTHADGIRDYELIYENLIDPYSYCEEGAVFYFGVQPKEISIDDESECVHKMYQYDIYAKGTKGIVVLGLITFILLIVQAVCMIRATGKTQPDNTEITLNRYDRLPTEIWIILNVTILFACILVCYATAGSVYYPGEWESIEYILISTSAMPFGYFFMILTLSLARRVKANTLWKGSLLNWIICKITGKPTGLEKDAQQSTKPTGKFAQKWDTFKEYVCNIRGTSKLMLISGIYIAVAIFLCIMAIGCGGDEPLVLFILLQIIALAAIVWIIKDIDKLMDGVTEITKGNLDYKVEINEKASVFRELADGINHIGDGLKGAVETSIKDERMKTELITNVSHDLKTPLTSIINYIDLLKKEDMQSEDAKHYIEVLDAKSQRLKQLTEDLVEAAKATSGNIELEMMPIAFDELMKQALGEFEDKFEKRNLSVIATYPGDSVVIIADGRRLFRIIENVLQNVYKYALEGTRVYVDLSKCEGMVVFTLKNISASPLNISPEELMERFTRGDSSRTTEGSGLGLSIAKELTRLQNGRFEIQLDGDLFKVIIQFPQHNS